MSPTSDQLSRVPYSFRILDFCPSNCFLFFRHRVFSLSAEFIIAAVLILVQLMPQQCLGQDKVTSLCDIHYPSDELVEWECVQLTPKDTPRELFGDYWEDVLRFNRIDRRHFRAGTSIKVPVNLDDVDGFTPLPPAYPDAEDDDKFILVDLSEMFLGAYEKGALVESFPIAVGIQDHPVPKGDFRVDALDSRHESNLYRVEEVDRPYPMHYGLRFHVDKKPQGWVSYWIHGRDLPGYPASHGCIGLYDEEMQNEYYMDHDQEINRSRKWKLKKPYLRGARELYLWVLGTRLDAETFRTIDYGPRVRIVGTAPSLPRQ